MKKLLVLAFLATTMFGCDQENGEIGSAMVRKPTTMREDAEEIKQPAIKFDRTEINTGKISQGEVVDLEFRYTNTGEAPLLISDVQGSCGCTITEFSKKPVAPGESGLITARFDSANKWGEQVVAITVLTNTIPNSTTLIINTNIIVPDNMQKPQE